MAPHSANTEYVPLPLADLQAKQPLRHEYTRWNGELRDIFPPAEHPGCVYPPNGKHGVEQFIATVRRAPELQQLLTRGFISEVRGIERCDHIVNRKELYNHQWGQILHCMLTLHSAYSYIFRGEAGSGKTLNLRVVRNACLHVQRAEELEGNILYATGKQYYLGQQTLGHDARERVLLNAADAKHAQKLYTTARSLLGKNLSAFFPLETWKTLFQDGPLPYEEAHRALRTSLEKRGCFKAFAATELPDGTDALRALACLISGTGLAVRGGGKMQPEFLEILSPKTARARKNEVLGGGDMGGLPRDIDVFSTYGWTSAELENRDPKVVQTTMNVFTNVLQLLKYQRILARNAVTIFDEGKTGEQSARGPVEEAGGKRIYVFAAGAHCDPEKWSLHSPQHTLDQLIEAGVLPPMGFDVFPGADETLFRSETEGAVRQLVEKHFEDLEILKGTRQPQPRFLNAVFIVHTALTRRVTDLLRARFRGSDVSAAIVHALDGKANPKEKEALLDWFVHDRGAPNVLVLPPSIGRETLDLPNIGVLTIGFKTSSPVLLESAAKRSSHSMLQRIFGPDFRTLVRQQLFSNSDPRFLLPRIMGHHALTDQATPWIPGHCLASRRSYERDCRRARRRAFATRLIPGITREDLWSFPLKAAASASLLPKTIGQIIPADTSKAAHMRDASAAAAAAAAAERSTRHPANPEPPERVQTAPASALPKNGEGRGDHRTPTGDAALIDRIRFANFLARDRHNLPSPREPDQRMVDAWFPMEERALLNRYDIYGKVEAEYKSGKQDPEHLKKFAEEAVARLRAVEAHRASQRKEGVHADRVSRVSFPEA